MKCKESGCLDESGKDGKYCDNHRTQNIMLGGCFIYFIAIFAIALLAGTFKFVMWCFS